MALDAVLEIAEIFLSIQGEGRFLGQPTVFVRTWGCNLDCRWCDTPQAKAPAEPQHLTVRQVLARVHYLAAQCRKLETVTVTGGEPTLQPHLDVLCAALRDTGYRVALETNGTIARELAVDFVSISPKLPSSPGRGWKTAEKPLAPLKPLCFWTINFVYQLKFVVNAAADEESIVALVTALGAPPGNVYLMPQGKDVADLRARTPMCIAICLRHGWNFTPRAHIQIFGNTPGR